MKRLCWIILLLTSINYHTLSAFSSQNTEETDTSIIIETDSLPADSQDIIVDMDPPLKITTPLLIPAVMKSAYKEIITTKGGSESFIYMSTELPSGISISEAGIISGTPEGPPGEYQVSITATDLKFPEKKETRNYVFTVFAPLEIVTTTIPDALIETVYKTKFEPTGGSGHYEFTADDLPANLVISKKGKLSGKITEKSGQYSFKATLTDSKAFVSIEKVFQQNIVDYFPDKYENLNDNVFDTANTMKPGDKYQKHNFNFNGDEDYILLDLTGVPEGDVIDIQTFWLTQPTTIHMSLYDSDKSIITAPDIRHYEPVSRYLYECINPGIFFIKIEETKQRTGDYGFSLTNTGPKVHIVTTTIPDALTSGTYQLPIEVEKGSGSYVFSAVGLPDGVTIDQKGVISGTMQVPSGRYPFTIRVDDTPYPGIFTEKELILNVVDFFPDEYELKNDNSFQTTNKMKPGDPSQNHTFNQKGDEDYIQLDLSGVAVGDLLDIKTSELTQTTDTRIILYDSQKKSIVSDGDGAGGTYSRLLYECRKPGYYYIKIQETNNRTGDYAVSMVNTGRKIQIATTMFPDVLSNNRCDFTIHATDGSGSYSYFVKSLPDGLTMDDKGLVSGHVAVPSGSYSFTLRVNDTSYPGIFAEKNFTLNVVDFFPDDYETKKDNGFQSTNTMKPGDPIQYHTFNYTGDEDFIRLDLNGVHTNDVIQIKTGKRTQLTDTSITLYDEAQNIILSNDNGQTDKYSELIFECGRPGIYFVVVKETDQKTGDYNFEMTNTGQKLSITTKTVPDALKASPYTTRITATGGSGNYKFTGIDLPEYTTLGKDGTISGGIPDVTGSIPFTIRIDDTTYPGIYTEKSFTLKIVAFFPDIYEIAGDNDFNSTNTLVPNAEVQKHTFNTIGDSDYFRLNLTDIKPGDVIKIESNRFTVATDTKLTLYNSDYHVVASDSNGGNEKYSKIVFHCKKPGTYYLKSEEIQNALGDYTISMINTGPKLQITTSKIPDILKATPYKFRIPSTGGSGGHTFTIINNLPEGLNFNKKGMISGNVAIESKSYLFAVKACDALHPENNTQKEIAMTVVDYYPDSFEVNGDNDFQTTNTMVPGTSQEHNFNSKEDEDFIRLDLGDVTSGDVLIFETAKLTTLTDTTLSLYNSSHEFLVTNDNNGRGNYSKIVFNCKTPGIYYLKNENRQKKTGDYRLLVNNSGQKLKIATKSTPIAESVEKFNTAIDATGGSGEYVYIISKGTLPDGLSIEPKTGYISGNNINWGTYIFTVHAKDQYYPENNHSRNFKIEAYMGKKITGTKTAVYPHYLSGTFSTDIAFTHTIASPSSLSGGTPNNLRYEIVSHNIPTPRFDIMFNNKSGVLKLKELSPLACKLYNDIDMEIEVKVKDRVCTNNTFTFRYHVPAKCLKY